MSDIGRYITLPQKVEAAYPNWSTSILIDNLRHTGPLDSSQFQQILGTAPGITIEPKNTLTVSDRDELRATITHTTSSSVVKQESVSISLLGDRLHWVMWLSAFPAVFTIQFH